MASSPPDTGKHSIGAIGLERGSVFCSVSNALAIYAEYTEKEVIHKNQMKTFYVFQAGPSYCCCYLWAQLEIVIV